MSNIGRVIDSLSKRILQAAMKGKKKVEVLQRAQEARDSGVTLTAQNLSQSQTLQPKGLTGHLRSDGSKEEELSRERAVGIIKEEIRKELET